MLKFDDLGWGPKVNPNGYSALLDEAKITEATLQLAAAVEAGEGGEGAADAKTTNGSVRLRHVGTGVVVEGHFGYKAEAESDADSVAIKTNECVLTVKGSINRVVPEGSTDLDLSGLFWGAGDNALDAGDCVVEGGVGCSIVGPAEGDPADKCIVRLETAAPKAGTKVTVNFDLTTGAATTHNNAETVNLDPGDYQIHLVARASNDNECTHMPNPTMMEFVKHCRPLNIRW